MYVFESIGRFLAIPRRLTDIQLTLQRLEKTMGELGTQFDQTLSDLGQAIDELATRITNLPSTPAEVDQADLDALKASVVKIQGLAQAAPTIPIPGSPEPTEEQPGTETPAEPTDVPVDEQPATEESDVKAAKNSK